MSLLFFFFFSSRRRHTRLQGDWSSDVCSSDLRGNWKEYHRPCRPTVWVSRLASGCQRGWTALLNSSRDSDPFLSASICAKLLLTAGRASASFLLSLPSRLVSARSNAACTSLAPADDGVGAGFTTPSRAPP